MHEWRKRSPACSTSVFSLALLPQPRKNNNNTINDTIINNNNNNNCSQLIHQTRTHPRDAQQSYRECNRFFWLDILMWPFCTGWPPALDARTQYCTSFIWSNSTHLFWLSFPETVVIDGTRYLNINWLQMLIESGKTGLVSGQLCFKYSAMGFIKRKGIREKDIWRTCRGYISYEIGLSLVDIANDIAIRAYQQSNLYFLINEIKLNSISKFLVFSE